MSQENTDIHVTLARVTTTLEHHSETFKGVLRLLEKSDERHEGHEKCCNENKLEIKDINASRRTLKWVLGFVGVSGLGAMFKGLQ